MNTEKLNRDLYAYCASEIEDFQLMESLALTRIDHMRCPLEQAFPELYSRMESCIEDYLYDNDLEDAEVDVEDVFWATE